MEIKSIKKIQSDWILEMKILEIFTGSTETSFINRIEEMEELLSGSKDMMEEMNKLMKEHVKSKNI